MADKPMQLEARNEILIVDDDNDVRESLCDVLEQCGFVVVSAGNGQEALELLRNRASADLVLLDLQMPIMDGWEFLRQYHTDLNFVHVPVVVLSASTPPFPDDVDAVLRKPVSIVELLETIGHYTTRTARHLHN
jgi:CheY-like chemotaxis protein